MLDRRVRDAGFCAQSLISKVPGFLVLQYYPGTLYNLVFIGEVGWGCIA